MENNVWLKGSKLWLAEVNWPSEAPWQSLNWDELANWAGRLNWILIRSLRSSPSWSWLAEPNVDTHFKIVSILELTGRIEFRLLRRDSFRIGFRYGAARNFPLWSRLPSCIWTCNLAKREQAGLSWIPICSFTSAFKFWLAELNFITEKWGHGSNAEKSAGDPEEMQ
jgi:hypothetical protein